jgi:hypothetical protein
MRRQTLFASLTATGLFLVCTAQPPEPTVHQVQCNVLPKVPDCGNPPKPDGLYRLKSRAQLKDGRDLCLDVDTGSGRYQQLDCRNVPSSHFFFSTGGRTDHCYRIEQERLGGRETASDVTGIGFNQLDPTCRPSILGVQWQLVPVPRMPGFFQIKNEQTGQCIDADNNNLTPAGLITPQACQAVTNQFWMLFK